MQTWATWERAAGVETGACMCWVLDSRAAAAVSFMCGVQAAAAAAAGRQELQQHSQQPWRRHGRRGGGGQRRPWRGVWRRRTWGLGRGWGRGWAVDGRMGRGCRWRTRRVSCTQGQWSGRAREFHEAGLYTPQRREWGSHGMQQFRLVGPPPPPGRPPARRRVCSAALRPRALLDPSLQRCNAMHLVLPSHRDTVHVVRWQLAAGRAPYMQATLTAQACRAHLLPGSARLPPWACSTVQLAKTTI